MRFKQDAEYLLLAVSDDEKDGVILELAEGHHGYGYYVCDEVLGNPGLNLNYHKTLLEAFIDFAERVSKLS